jgi:hypothetical protein
MPSSTKKLMRSTAREFPGVKLSLTARSHIRIELPGEAVVYTGGTPSCQRVMQQVRAAIRRQIGARAGEGE